MKKQLCFLAPDLDRAKLIIEDLRSAGYGDEKINVVANDQIPLEDVPQADLRHGSDLVNAAKRGAATGGTVGALAGLLFVAFPPAGLALGGGAILGGAAAGAGFGVWASTLVGVSATNSEIKEFQDAIDDGQILIIIDAINHAEVERVEHIVRDHHPEAVIRSGEL
ncbi:hypothetical protein ACXYTJ_12115 [Gilvimarinus sp. F26214L]|uniref:hypothetical protein n=1 Tax=Gilvimarinus sp. DZF01 TaxID=3461371 RepID=UPI004045DE34